MAIPSSSCLAARERRRFLTLLGGLLLGGATGLHAPRLEARLDQARLRRSMEAAHGRSGLDVLEEWFALLDRLEGADLSSRLREVNDFFNRRVRWIDDINVWRQTDYWATPLETLGRGKGDCEDYSIAKYVTLRQLGIPGDKLRMIYVRAHMGRTQITQAHMVLGYYPTPSAEPLILDNLVSTIAPARSRLDLDPVFSFNSRGLWTGRSPRSRADPVARLSRWRSVLDRIRLEGFNLGG